MRQLTIGHYEPTEKDLEELEQWHREAKKEDSEFYAEWEANR